MQIEVKGHSGCSIEIVRQGNTLIIEKATRDPKYVERLYKQALKQQKAQSTELQFIRVPEILNITKSDTEMVMQMEYIYSKNFIDYFENAGFEQIKYFVKAIDIFIQSEISQSTMQEVSSSIVTEKFEDVKRKTLSNPFMRGNREVEDIILRSEKQFQALPTTLEMPVGICHGDLTFSNILFNGNNYFLIDFLDSFIESPLLDMVKIRQDSAHRWSPLMYEGDYDKTRFNIIAHKIDQELDTLFSRYDWYVRYYDIFQLMNLLRVLQYGHEEKVVNYLVKEISSILNKMESKNESQSSKAVPSTDSFRFSYRFSSNPNPSSDPSFSFSFRFSSASPRSLIMPIAADKPEYSTRLPRVFLIAEDGVMHCIRALKSLDLTRFDHIYITILRHLDEQYALTERLSLQFRINGITNAEIVVLDQPTTSQPETIYETIRKKDIHGSIFIKDADCSFAGDDTTDNAIVIHPLEQLDWVNPKNKSYVSVDDMYYITNIIEKRIVSHHFTAGGYSFQEADTYCQYYESLQHQQGLYLSHIIYTMLLDGHTFRPVLAKEYEDFDR